MGKKANDMVRKIKNEHFIKAFDYVAERLHVNQTELAAVIDSKAAYISGYRNGTRPVPSKTIEALVRISATIDGGHGQIYTPYLMGESEYMLLCNVPDDEIIEVERRRNNPDYEIINQQKKQTHTPYQYPSEDTYKMIDSISYLISGMFQEFGRMKDELADVKKQLVLSIEENKRLRETIASDHSVLLAISKELTTIRRAALSRYDSNQATEIPLAAENSDL